MDRIFDYNGAEWTDLPSRVLNFDDETHCRTGAELQVALQQGRSYRCQRPMRRKDDSTVWIGTCDCLLPDSRLDILMMLVDITPLQAAEDQGVRISSLEAHNFQLREMVRLETYFVSNMSHELRTPLNAILGFEQMLRAVGKPVGRHWLLLAGTPTSRKSLTVVT